MSAAITARIEKAFPRLAPHRLRRGGGFSSRAVVPAGTGFTGGNPGPVDGPRCCCFFSIPAGRQEASLLRGDPFCQGWPSPRSRIPAGLGTAFPQVPEDLNLLVPVGKRRWSEAESLARGCDSCPRPVPWFPSSSLPCHTVHTDDCVFLHAGDSAGGRQRYAWRRRRRCAAALSTSRSISPTNSPGESVSSWCMSATVRANCALCRAVSRRCITWSKSFAVAIVRVLRVRFFVLDHAFTLSNGSPNRVGCQLEGAAD